MADKNPRHVMLIASAQRAATLLGVGLPESIVYVVNWSNENDYHIFLIPFTLDPDKMRRLTSATAHSFEEVPRLISFGCPPEAAEFTFFERPKPKRLQRLLSWTDISLIDREIGGQTVTAEFYHR